MIVSCPTDPRLYARVVDHADGTLVTFWKRAHGWDGNVVQNARYLGGGVIDVPFHVALDHVHALLASPA